MLTALIMSFYGLPNQILFVIAGILIMIFFVLPLFLVLSNRQSTTNKKINWGFTLCNFLLIPILFFFLQDGKHLSFKTATILLSFIGAYILWYIINAYRQKKFIWNKVSFFHYWITFIILFISCLPIEMQLADKSFNPKIENPIYPQGDGPLIYFDGGHNNFHTLDTRLFATGKLLEQDGYHVESFNKSVSLNNLRKCEIFLISNALSRQNSENWSSPIYPAFTNDEVRDIKKWVFEGGALFLIADHTPFGGAIDNLASQFGFEYEVGYSSNTNGNENYFYRKSNSLLNNSITNGRNKSERVDSILILTGSDIKLPADATPILNFDSGYSQGAYKNYGKGRVVVFGEAMMFTAQLGFGLSWIKIGMNSESSPNNYQLFLNSIHWLDGLIE